MPEATEDPLLAPSAPQDQPIALRSPRDLIFEITVVLLICVIPHLFNSIASLCFQFGPSPYLYQSLSGVVQSLGFIALILFVIFRSGEAPDRFGLKRFRVVLDPLWGIGVYVSVFVSYRLLWVVLYFLERNSLIAISRRSYSFVRPPSGGGNLALLAIHCLSNGFAEELVMRAYLIPRFEQLFKSTGLAIIFSTILFAGYHTYQGEIGAISAAEFGLPYGVIFCIFRRIWPLAIGHALQDFVSLARMR